MDKLASTAHTAYDSIKNKISTLGDALGSSSETSEPLSDSGVYVVDDKGRLHDPENGRFVARKKAMGAKAVAQVIKPVTSKTSIAEVVSSKPIKSKLSTENQEKLAKLDSENYHAWNRELANGRNMDDAFNEAMQLRQQRQGRFEREMLTQNMDSIDSGSAQTKRVFIYANQVRQARAEFERQLNEGVEGDYDVSIKQREDKLQELLIKYSSDIPQDQQDFIVEYASGTYNKFLGTPAIVEVTTPEPTGQSNPEPVTVSTVTTTDPSTAGRDITPSVGETVIVSAGSNGEDDLEVISVVADSDVVSDAPESENIGDSDGLVSGPPIPTGIVSETQIEDTSNTEVADIDSQENPSDGPEEGDLIDEAAPDEIAFRIMSENPDVYERYIIARDKYVAEQAKARGANVPSPEKKSFIMRLRERFSRDNDQRQADMQEFGPAYGDALTAALVASGEMTADQNREERMSLEADARYWLERDILEMKLASGGEESSPVSKKALLGGLVLATGLGVVTGVYERWQSGNHELKFLLLGAGLGAAAGAGAGYAASKSVGSQFDESYIEDSALSARDMVYQEYRSAETGTLEDRFIALEGTEETTNSEKKKNRGKQIGAIALGGLAGGAAGAGGHLLVDAAWPFLSSIDFTPTKATDLAGADLTTETFDPLDTNRDGVVNDQDWKDVNNDGVIDYRDENPTETFDPLDSNRDGDVNSKDMPDTNDDGVIDTEDQVEAETFDPLDSNRDGDVNSKDMPDTNDDGVIDTEDQVEAETFDPLDTNEDGKVDGKDWPDTNEDGIIDYRDEQPVENEASSEPVEVGETKIVIEQDSSFTREFMQLYDIDGDQAHDLYHYLDDKYGAEQIFDGDNTYIMPDGEMGLHPGEATISTEMDNAAQNWIKANTK